VIRFLYNLLWPVGLLLLLPGYLRKMFRRGGYRRNFGQRFAIYDRAVRARLGIQPPVWLHAVSVGEAAIALKLARSILQIKADARFALTTTTTTGFAFAENNAVPEIEVLYTPLDFWPVMRRAFTVINPERVILVEAEVWPNLMANAARQGIPVALVNARLSPRSERRFLRFRTFVAPAFRQLDLVCVPEAEDVERWSALGVIPDRITHTGSIKYDPEEPAANRSRSIVEEGQAQRPVLLGGSTHPGEEEILARVFLELRSQFPDLLLFLAPRHVERVAQLRKQLESMSLRVRLCSELDGNLAASAEVLLLDRTGDLRSWYPLGSVVFVGKSLAAAGGQNPVEPITAGKPVIFGPHMENFASLAAELIRNHGGIEVRDQESMAAAVADLLKDSGRRVQLVENARRVIDHHRGATMRTAELVLQMSKMKWPGTSLRQRAAQ
jgi:3-deoxy-D-manno-octulosonic-acid transferase